MLRRAADGAAASKMARAEAVAVARGSTAVPSAAVRAPGGPSAFRAPARVVRHESAGAMAKPIVRRGDGGAVAPPTRTCAVVASARPAGGPGALSRSPSVALRPGAQSRSPPKASGVGSQRRSFETHAERRFDKAQRKAWELISELTPPAIRALAQGESESSQVPEGAAEDLLLAAFLMKGGPDGGSTHKALRFWRLLRAEAARYGLPDDGLPASRALVAYIVRGEATRAASAGVGSRGGATVGGTVRDGALLLMQVGLPIRADGLLVEAAAMRAGPRVAAPRSHAGSLPIGLQCQFEFVAGGQYPTVLRTMARAFLVSSLLVSVRLNDALNSKPLVDEIDPDGVVRGVATVASKDGMPLNTFAPALGWLGPLWWLSDHVAEMAGRGHAVPDYSSRPAGRPSAPGARLEPGVCGAQRARDAFRDIAAQPPLSMTSTEFAALNITTHSPHGTTGDMIRFMSAHGLPEGRPFGEPDARASGHWLRDRNAPQPDPRRVPGAPQRGQPDGAPTARGGMSFRYTQGAGRRGEREEQLQLRTRFVLEVSRAVRRECHRCQDDMHWRSWRTLESWDILRPQGVAEGA